MSTSNLKVFEATYGYPNVQHGKNIQLRAVARMGDVTVWAGFDRGHELGMLVQRVDDVWRLHQPGDRVDGARLALARGSLRAPDLQVRLLGAVPVESVIHITRGNRMMPVVATTCSAKHFELLRRGIRRLQPTTGDRTITWHQAWEAAVERPWDTRPRRPKLRVTNDDLRVALRLEGWRPTGEGTWHYG